MLDPPSETAFSGPVGRAPQSPKSVISDRDFTGSGQVCHWWVCPWSGTL